MEDNELLNLRWSKIYKGFPNINYCIRIKNSYLFSKISGFVDRPVCSYSKLPLT